jgi:hypothetical protein
MLVDGGAIVNLMSYSLFKKLGGSDEELIKTNMTVSEVGGGEPMGAKGVISMELTIESKALATASSSLRHKVTSILSLVVIGFMKINVFLLLCTKC